MKNPSFKIYEEHITNMSDYFRIFYAIQQMPFQLKPFMELRERVESISDRSDNFLLLKAKLEAIIAGSKGK